MFTKAIRTLNKFRIYQMVSWCVYTVRKSTGSLPPPPSTVPGGREEYLLPDNQRRVGTKSFRENIIKMVDLARIRQAEPVLLTSPVYPGTTGNYNSALREIARDQKVWLIDLDNVFRQHGIRRLLLDDCHPTAEGNRIIAEKLAELIPFVITRTEPRIVEPGPKHQLLSEPGGHP